MSDVLQFPDKTVRERVKDELQKRDEAINAALSNETLTRARVEALEQAMTVVAALYARPFLGRLKWVLLGR